MYFVSFLTIFIFKIFIQLSFCFKEYNKQIINLDLDLYYLYIATYSILL